MKLLHTSDWHLGHTLYNYDRSYEQTDFLAQLARIVAKEQPDVMVISGDIYHYSNPSAATQRMYTEGMLSIHQACPEMTIVVTAGNHDSSSKLEIDSSLWKHFSVHVIGSIERYPNGQVNLDKHIIAIRPPSGETKGYVAAVPHVYPQNFPLLTPNASRDQRLKNFFHALLDKATRENVRHLPIVLTAHLSVDGSDSTGHDESAGGMEYVPLSDLGQGYDYLALGHIHCPQTLRNSRQRARYCGTPLPVNFEETYPHSVSLVEIEAGQKPDIRTVAIHNPLPLVTLPPSPLPFNEALQALEEFPEDRPAYIRLNVLFESNLPGCNERASQAAKGKACKFCYIKSNRKTALQDTMNPHLYNLQEFLDKSPLEIACLYYLENEGEEMSEEMRRLMSLAIQQVKQKQTL